VPLEGGEDLVGFGTGDPAAAAVWAAIQAAPRLGVSAVHTAATTDKMH